MLYISCFGNFILALHLSLSLCHLHSFQVYDADNFATLARFFMLRKVKHANSSQPGDPGRWALRSDISGLVALNELLSQLQGMSDTYLTYDVLQVWALAAR